jgi:hypothetical protein
MTLALIEDLAPELGVAPSTLREWCRRGEFPNIRYPGKRRIHVPRDWADEYLSGDCELEVRPLARGGRVVRPAKQRRAA